MCVMFCVFFPPLVKKIIGKHESVEDASKKKTDEAMWEAIQTLKAKQDHRVKLSSASVRSLCVAVLQSAAVCCSVLQCVAVCCSVLQCIAVC